MKKIDTLALKSAQRLLKGNYGYFAFSFSLVNAVLWFLFYLYYDLSSCGFIAILSLASALASFHVRGFELLLKKTEQSSANESL